MRRPSPPPALPPLSPWLRQHIERACDERGEQVQRIVARGRRDFPHYAALSGEALDGLIRNVDMVVGAFYRLQLLEGREPTREEFEPQRRAARQRVSQGVPLHEMVGCYQAGLPMLWADLIASIGDQPDIHTELLQRVPVTISANTLITTVVTEAYVEERERTLRTRGEAFDELLRLFSGDQAPLGVLEARARALGLGLDTPRTLALFRPALDDERASSSAADVVRRLFRERALEHDVVIGSIEQGVLALLPDSTDRLALADLAGKLRGLGWRTGIGGPGRGAEGLRRSIREALRAVEIGEVLARQHPLDRYADLAVLDLVDVGSPRALDFARRALGALAAPGANRTHLRTLRALCESGFRHKLAAAALDVHAHTLSYRLAQIRRLHGLDLDDAQTRLRVHLALLIVDV